MFCKFSQYEPRQQLDLLIGALRGEPQDMGSSDATLSSPEDLFDKLRLRYSLRMSYTKFHELTIGPKEDLESFAHRITKMGRITASGNTLGVDDKMLRERFMHGIDRLVGDELVRRSPASLQEALRMAIVIREETRTARRPQLHAVNSPNQWLDQSGNVRAAK